MGIFLVRYVPAYAQEIVACSLNTVVVHEKLLDSDWLRVVPLLCSYVQKSVIPCNYNYNNIELVGLETLLFKVEQSRATRKWRDLTCYA